MALGYDPNMTVDFDTSMLSEDFIDYLNAYISKMCIRDRSLPALQVF